MPKKDSISATERRRREEAVNSARATQVLSGYKPSEEAEARALRYITGEIDLDEFLHGELGIVHSTGDS